MNLNALTSDSGVTQPLSLQTLKLRKSGHADAESRVKPTLGLVSFRLSCLGTTDHGVTQSVITQTVSLEALGL